MDDILIKKDKSAIRTLTSEYIDEGIARITEINLEKIFALDPVEIQGKIIRANLGSGSPDNLIPLTVKPDILEFWVRYSLHLKTNNS
jgi:hypothetical protein